MFETESSRYRLDLTDDEEERSRGVDVADSFRTEMKSHNGKHLSRVDQGDGHSYWVNESTGSICDDISSRRPQFSQHLSR